MRMKGDAVASLVCVSAKFQTAKQQRGRGIRGKSVGDPMEWRGGTSALDKAHITVLTTPTYEFQWERMMRALPNTSAGENVH